jgi:Fur family ferric uptake transcriptional regulator
MNEDLDKKLKQKNITPTSMRRLVLDILNKKGKAISLYEIEKEFDHVERSTIFRTLKTFQDHCIIHSVDDGTGAVKYALCDDDCTCNLDDQHLHFLCNNCGQTHCLKEIPVPRLEMPEGFDLESVNFVAKGICPNCK